MNRLIYVCLSAYMFVCFDMIQTEMTCLNPDVPENGNYTSEHSKLEPGDEIKYSCKNGFALSGKARRVCSISNGHWSEHTPFCDPAACLKNPIIVDLNTDNLSPDARMRDRDTNTCIELQLSTNHLIKVPLEKRLIIRTVRIFFKKGPINIKIFTDSSEKMATKANHTSFLESDQWVVFQWEDNYYVNMIMIAFTEKSRFSICEIEVYGKTAESCDLSPFRKIFHGHLEVSRSKAVLICDDGFMSRGRNRLVCEGNNVWIGGPLVCEEVLCDLLLSLEQPGVTWIFPNKSKKFTFGTIGQLKCAPGFKKLGEPETISCQKNGMWTKTDAVCVEEVETKEKIKKIVVGSVALVVVIIIIVLLAIIIYFIRKQKSKEVVVVYKHESEENVASQLEREYQLPPYEGIHIKPPEPPSTPRPLAKLSTMSRGGDTQSTAWKATFVKNDIIINHPERVGDAMKPSTIYGS